MIGALVTLLFLGLVARMGWARWAGGNDGNALEDVLARAEASGIISAEQRTRILADAREHASGVQLSGATWLAVFAGLFVVAGVTLLVAHNWQHIGPAVRVAAFLVALGVVGELALRSRERSLALSLPLELLWLFLPLVGIGLYGQTFQLSGDPIQPFLVWLTLTAPLAWLSPRPVVASLHVLALVSVLFAGNFALGGMLALTRAPGGVGSATIAAWLLSIVILAVAGIECVRLLPQGHRRHFFAVIALWIFALLATSTPFQMRHSGWLTLAAISIATSWLVAQLLARGSTPERLTGVVFWLSTLYAATFFWHASEPLGGDTTPGGTAVTIAALIAAVGGALALPKGRIGADTLWETTAKVLLAAPALVALLFLADDLRAVQLAAALMNVILVAIAVALMWHGSLVRDVSQINVGILVLLVVLVTRFVDVFGSLLQGGIGFIVAGVLLAALAYGLERARRRLIALPEGTR
jgi:uncharacterized membrane protein